MTRVFNFSAGPAALPEPVLRQAADEMLDWHGCGMSVMEMSHRGKEFIAIHAEAEALLRELLAVPANYKVLFLQGGAIGRERHRADEPAARQDQRRLRAHRRMVEEVDQGGEEVLPRSTSPPAPKASGFTSVPPRDDLEARPRCRLRAHLLATRPSAASSTTGRPTPATCRWWPTCPATSCRAPSTWPATALIYGGAQKNIGPAGLTIVIVRDDLIGQALPITPSAFDYKQQADNDSMLNTPPTYAIYIAGLVFNWIKAQGGLAAMAAHNQRQGGAAVRLPRPDQRSTATRWRATTAR